MTVYWPLWLTNDVKRAASLFTDECDPAEQVQLLLRMAAAVHYTRRPPTQHEIDEAGGLGPIIAPFEGWAGLAACWVIDYLGVDPLDALSGWGVYCLIDKRGTVFYVGMTGRPSRRLATHRREFGDLIADIQWRPTDDRRSALDLEQHLIDELNPRMNLAGVRR